MKPMMNARNFNSMAGFELRVVPNCSMTERSREMIMEARAVNVGARETAFPFGRASVGLDGLDGLDDAVDGALVCLARLDPA